MIELWELHGEFWRIPVSVDAWQDTLAEITIGAGLPLTLRQHDAVSKLIENKISLGNGKIFIYRPDLESIATRSEQLNPEDVLYWAPGWKPVEVQTITEVENDFIVGYCQSAYAVNRDPFLMSAIWLSLCRYMLHWLVNERKNLMLGFATIVPLTLRKNWASVIVKREWDKYRKDRIARSLFSPHIQSMIDRGVADELCSSSVVAHDHVTRTFRDTLEIVTEEAFHETVCRREKIERKGVRRLYNIADVLRHQLPRALKVYAHYLNESFYSSVTIRESRVDGRTGKWKWTPVSSTPDKVEHPDLENRALFPSPPSAGEPGDVSGATEPLPDQVPDL